MATDIDLAPLPVLDATDASNHYELHPVCAWGVFVEKHDDAKCTCPGLIEIRSTIPALDLEAAYWVIDPAADGDTFWAAHTFIVEHGLGTLVLGKTWWAQALAQC
ncbi:hypothetical protein [Demequina sp.]|uniref:hypothetical protein n=1 Tax=Demequina sp. TaxID=2050685 RepID=UPI003D0ED44B